MYRALAASIALVSAVRDRGSAMRMTWVDNVEAPEIRRPNHRF